MQSESIGTAEYISVLILVSELRESLAQQTKCLAVLLLVLISEFRCRLCMFCFQGRWSKYHVWNVVGFNFTRTSIALCKKNNFYFNYRSFHYESSLHRVFYWYIRTSSVAMCTYEFVFYSIMHIIWMMTLTNKQYFIECNNLVLFGFCYNKIKMLIILIILCSQVGTFKDLLQQKANYFSAINAQEMD